MTGSHECAACRNQTDLYCLENRGLFYLQEAFSYNTPFDITA